MGFLGLLVKKLWEVLVALLSKAPSFADVDANPFGGLKREDEPNLPPLRPLSAAVLTPASPPRKIAFLCDEEVEIGDEESAPDKERRWGH